MVIAMIIEKWKSFVRTALSMAGACALTACLVGSDKPTTFRTIDDHSLHVYRQGDSITYAFSGSRILGGPSTTINGTLVQKWEATAINNRPFPPHELLNVVRQTTTETISGETEKTSIQYMTQSADGADKGSMLLHGYPLPPNNSLDSQWVDRDQNLQAGGDPPAPAQVFWSPFSQEIGVERSANELVDYFIMGNCSASSCEPLGQMKFSRYQIISNDGVVKTPLATFKTYRFQYTGVFIPTTAANQQLFDIRLNCWEPGTPGQVTISGQYEIYPAIGIVSFEMYCNSINTGTTLIGNIIQTTIDY